MPWERAAPGTHGVLSLHQRTDRNREMLKVSFWIALPFALIASLFASSSYYPARFDDAKAVYLRLFAEQRGEGLAVDEKGNVYLAAGQVFVYEPSGHLIDTIEVPERPSQLLFGSGDGTTLFILACSSLYAVQTRYKGQ
jgi:hypothetical protein